MGFEKWKISDTPTVRHNQDGMPIANEGDKLNINMENAFKMRHADFMPVSLSPNFVIRVCN